MDAVTLAINGLDNNFLTSIASFLDNTILFLIIVSIIAISLEKDNKKRTKLVTAVFIAVLLGTAIKTLTGVPRPCYELDLKTNCTGGYSFPSNHTIVAFTLALGFLDDKRYAWVLLFALFVGFTRIYLGVHTFIDVTASMALSPLVYEMVDYYWKGRFK